MKLQKLAIAVLFAGGLIGSSAAMASASDATPQISIDCVEGYKGVYSDDGSSGTCEPIATTFEEPTDGSCWTTADGGNVCARGGVNTLGSTEDPVDPVGCSTAPDADGNPVTICADAIPYSTPPLQNDGTGVDCSVDAASCEDIMPAVGDESLMFKNYSAAPLGTTSNSNTLAALGVLVAALGAFGIGLSNQKAAKK
jgi:hypothetical protein